MSGVDASEVDGSDDEGLLARLEGRANDAFARVRAPNYLSGIAGAAYGALMLPLFILSPIVTILPPTWKLYHKLHAWSAWQMQKAAGADALANLRLQSGREDVRPAKWVEGSEDEKDLTGWRVKGLGGKRYDAAVNGTGGSRFGKADLIHINEDDREQGTWAECVMDNAIKADRERYLFRDATLVTKQTTISVGDLEDGANGAAVADGGVNIQQANGREFPVSVSSPGVLEDSVIPLSSEPGYDGQVVSWNSYANLKSEKTDQEAVRDAKNSAWTAAKLDEIEGKDLLKWGLIIGAWSVLLLFHQDIGTAISNFGGGGAVGDAASGAGLGMISMGKAALGVI